MEPGIVIMLLTIPVLVGAIVTALTAKKNNQRWRERRAARLLAKQEAEKPAAEKPAEQ